MTWRRAGALVAAWVGSQVSGLSFRRLASSGFLRFRATHLPSPTQAVWLKYGYDLEMLGRPVYFQLWAAGLAFQVVNVGILSDLIAAYTTFQNDSELRQNKKE